MLARHFLTGLIALATVPTLTGPQVPEPPGRVLLAAAPLSDEIAALTVIEHSEGTRNRPPYLEVQLNGQSVRHGEPISKPLSGTIQAWLLCRDGTAVPQAWKPESVRLITVDLITDQMSVGFALTPPQELAGVVVRVNGKLYAREIKASPAP